MERKSIQIDGKQVFYTLYGNGAPVMLVHGFGEDDSIWRHQISALQNDFRLIVPQLPGTAASERLGVTTMESLAASLLQILEAEGVAQVVMIGHSMGGYITLAFAEAFADRLIGFGLFHSTAFADSEEKKANRRKGIEFIQEHGGAGFLRTITPNLFSEMTRNNRPELVKATVDAIPTYSDASLIAYYNAMLQRPDRTAVLRQATVPVFFMIGQHDQAAPYADTIQQAAMPETAQVTVLSDVGHLGMLEDTDASNQALREFLASFGTW